MDPVTGALIGGGASLLGGAMQIRANKKAAEKGAQQRAEEIGMIQKYGQRSMDALLPAYQAGQDIRQQGMERQLGLAGQIFQPMVETTQAGDYMAQQALISGLERQRQALLGGEMTAPAITPQNVPIDMASLSMLTNPEPLQFQQFQQPEFSDQGVTDWNASDAQNYLSANPDVRAGYEAQKSQLLAGGDPQFSTLEGYAKWHYDNFGRNEIAQGMRPELQGGSSTPSKGAFSSEQIANMLNSSGVRV